MVNRTAKKLGSETRKLPRARGVGLFLIALIGCSAPIAMAQDFSGILRQLTKPTRQQPATAQADATTSTGQELDPPEENGQDGANGAKLQRNWLGYSQQMEAIRPLLLKGDFAAARTAYETGKDAAGTAVLMPAAATNPGGSASVMGRFTSLIGANLGPTDGQSAQTASTEAMSPLAQKERTFLNNVEIGMMMFDSGELAEARGAFDAASTQVRTGAAGTAAAEKKGLLAGTGKVFRNVGRGAASIVGNPELGTYDAPDYERVLQLNYLSLSYLLAGDDRAFNVSRRVAERQLDAIENLNDKAARLQDEARVKFEAEQAEAQKKLAEAREGGGDESNKTDTKEAALKAAYETQDFCKPPNLPSAYVNPLGFYLNGVVYEISSLRYLEDIDSARISYEKALKLAPNSVTLQRAVRELNRPQGSAGRLVHVMVAEGFAPTRQAIRMQFAVGGVVAPITIPRLTCHPSQVASIEVRDTAGKVLGTLDPMANIEGMMLQRQKDREGIVALNVFVSALRGAAEKRLAQTNIFASMLVDLKQENFDRPDMRSWATLPARFHAGRIYAPKTATSLQVVSLNSSRQVISTQNVQLDSESKQNVVYLRATEQALIAAPPTQLWIKGL